MITLSPKALLRRPRAGAAAATLAVAAGLAAPSTSTAATYHHLTLNYAGYANADSWTSGLDGLGLGYHASVVLNDGLYTNWNVGGGRSSYTAGEYGSAIYHAPADTTLAHVAWTNRLTGFTSGPWENVVSDAVGNLLPGSAPAIGMYSRGADATGTTLLFRIACPSSSCIAAPDAYYKVDTVKVTLNDLKAPAGGVATGSLVGDTTLTGDEAVSFPATDHGSGVFRTVLYDGSDVIARQIVHTNDGHCTSEIGNRNYDRAVPCLLSATANATLDTTQLADGYHTLKVAVEDAAGNETDVYGPVSKLIGNHPPVNTRVPAAQDAVVYAAGVRGVPLSFASGGEWSGPNLVMSYAWLRCDADGNACAQIPDATGLSYTPGAADVGRRLRLAVTATNVADSVTVYSAPSGVIVAPKSESPITTKPTSPTTDTPTSPGLAITIPALPTQKPGPEHTPIGKIAGQPVDVACPDGKATLRFEHVKGGQVSLRYGKASSAQLLLTCTNTGKPITDAKIEIATQVGQQPAVAADVTTDGAGHATIRLNKGASRGITVGYRMFSDDALARATATLKVSVTGQVSLKANKKRLRNGQAVTLRGTLAGGSIPKRGVTLAVQWKDGKRWRPFAQIKSNRKGKFAYAYRFTRTTRTLKYQLRVQVTKGQVDYPYVAATSKPVKVTVAP